MKAEICCREERCGDGCCVEFFYYADLYDGKFVRETSEYCNKEDLIDYLKENYPNIEITE